MLKWALIVVVGLVALVLVAALIGALLPKGHVATRTARFKAKPETIWRALTAYAEQPAWRSDLKAVERLPDRGGHEVWNEVRKGAGAMPLETIESDPPRRLVRKIADPKLPFGGTWTYELRAEGGGCLLTITENGEVYNPIFRLVSKCFDMRRTIDEFLGALARKLGEELSFAG